MMDRDEQKHVCQCKSGFTRRGFLTTVGSGAVVAGALGRAEGADESSYVPEPGKLVQVTLEVNGRERALLVEPRWSLLFALREKLGLTETKMGCGQGECGACTVLIDDEPRYACMTLAVEAEGHRITTLTGVMQGEELGEVQQAFAAEDAFQCGYCTPGQIMAAEGLLRTNPSPSPEDVRIGMSGNLCRCGAYAHIFKAVEKAGELKRAKGGLS
jgi:xanthine dehydrogenase YagT iron-sulfur-binding subunit